MALNLSALFGQLNNTSQVNQNAELSKMPGVQGQSVSDNSGLAMLKNMLAGDTFSGKLVGLQDDTAIILLNDGSNVNARVADSTNMTVGQNITFMIEQNTADNISLKALSTNGQEAVLIDKALDAAGFPATDTNVNIVSNLLDLNMPIDAKTVGDMVKYAAQFPEANLNTIANLMRLDMPVTADNIAQFDAYRSLEHSISGNFDSIGSELNNIMGNIYEGTDASSTVAVQTLDFINTLYTADSSGGDSADIQSRLLSDVLSDNEINMLKEAFAGTDGEEIVSKLNSNTATVRDVTSALTNLTSDIFKDKPELKSEIQEITPKLINQMIDETLKITPENVAKQDGIKNYYKRVKSILEKAGEKLTDESFSAANKEMNQVKTNIDFMNDLNRNMTYFQMPVHFKNSNGEGELYVFTNKKALANNTDNVSAMLHLDMDNLGPVDVFVKMNGKNVSTNFCLESEELLDFVYSNIDKLNARLEQLGYNTKFEMTVKKENESFNFVDNFVEKDIPNRQTSQYVFDIKA